MRGHMDATNLQYLFYGFTAAWLIVTAFVLSLVLRERKLRDEMRMLQRMVEGRER